jgi:hypothetical protein
MHGWASRTLPASFTATSTWSSPRVHVLATGSSCVRMYVSRLTHRLAKPGIAASREPPSHAAACHAPTPPRPHAGRQAGRQGHMLPGHHQRWHTRSRS